MALSEMNYTGAGESEVNSCQDRRKFSRCCGRSFVWWYLYFNGCIYQCKKWKRFNYKSLNYFPYVWSKLLST